MGYLITNEYDLSVDTRKGWDEYITAHPHGSFYHLYNWKHVLKETFGFRPLYVVYKKEGRIKGACPLFLMRDIFARKYLVSNPFANFAGLLADTSEVEREIIAYVRDLAHEHGVEYVQLRSKGNAVHSGDGSLLTKDYFVSLFLNLGAGEAALWNRISSRNRNKIRAAGKEGFESGVGKEYLKYFYAIFAKNMKHLGTPVFPIVFFRKILHYFPDNTNIFVVKNEGRVASGMFLFWFKDTLSEPWVSSLRYYNRKYYINNFLYWEAIKYAIGNGFKCFDFGRSTRDSGTFNFTRQWGAEPEPLKYQHILCRSKGVSDVNQESNKYGLYISIWRHLPVAICNFFGPKLVRYLPEL